LAVTLTLIVALHLVDRIYRVFQDAAATRANILEKFLNLELTEVIGTKYRMGHVQRYVNGIYGAFTLGVSILGLAIFYPDYIYVLVLEAIAISVLIYTSRRYKPKYRYGLVDWRLHQLEYGAGEEIGITLTNLGEKEITYEKGTIMWGITREGDRIVRENDKKAIHIEKLDQQLSIEGDDSYTWLWRIPPKFKDGVYRVHRTSRQGGGLPLEPLRRKLMIIA
jgi:hypothetical protein